VVRDPLRRRGQPASPTPSAKPLIGLQFNQQRYEADYRFSLVRLRENAEGVALYRGENEELGTSASASPA